MVRGGGRIRREYILHCLDVEDQTAGEVMEAWRQEGLVDEREVVNMETLVTLPKVLDIKKDVEAIANHELGLHGIVEATQRMGIGGARPKVAGNKMGKGKARKGKKT